MTVKRLDGEKTREARLKRADGRCESVGAHGSTGPGAFRLKESRAAGIVICRTERRETGGNRVVPRFQRP